MSGSNPWFLGGLFATTVATLLLELLDTRLLSVLTWYHLSFFAVSTAMFGMAAGAVRVYLGGAEFEGDQARSALYRYALILAVAIPASHIVNLAIPIRPEPVASSILASVVSIVALAAPFYISGIVVAICLTRVPGSTGLIYAVDLCGAGLGALLIVPLLEGFSVSAAALTCGAITALGAICFGRFAGISSARGAALLAAVLCLGALVNDTTLHGLRVLYPKGNPPPFPAVAEYWTIHGQVVLSDSAMAPPSYWGPGRGANAYLVNKRFLRIDGGAGTTMTEWDGDRVDLKWVRHDVTSLPYHLRKGGDAAVIGVGGGRDILTALWANSRSVTGVEINRVFVHLLEGPLRGYARLADEPEVELVHDEARSYFTRTDRRFDVIQMSLIDTWAATGAGAFTLSENGLYTVEAWKVFLDALQPQGLFSVSRWYTAGSVSETSRIVSLATAALLERGVEDPSRHLALVATENVSTLILSPTPLVNADLEGIERTALRYGFEVLLSPGRRSGKEWLDRIAASPTRVQLERAAEHAVFDFSPPTDQRPYFFNILKPGWFWAEALVPLAPGVVARGNLMATWTLTLLWVVALAGVTIVILGPLWRLGLPRMDRPTFGHAVGYFALIGLGFMLVQIPLIQRFSIYLGHPTYTVAIILFSMILATGAGSYLSDRIPVERQRAWLRAIPLGIGALVLGGTLLIQPLIDNTIQLELLARSVIVVALVGTMALPLGFCFPIGLRLVRRISEDATPWMWGVNGACSVLASVSAVAVSMWAGIDTNLYVASGLYVLLAVPAGILWQRGEPAGDTLGTDQPGPGE